MRRWYGLDAVRESASVITIGVFDGVHRGHQRVVRRTVESARELDVLAVAVTFDPNPLAVLRPESTPPALCPLDRRLELFAELGIDMSVVVPFDRERSQQTAEDFVDELVGALRPQRIVVGSDFRFGHRAGGDVALLGKLGDRLGFTCEALHRGGPEGELPWSSTYVRARLSEGDVTGAAQVLGRDFEVAGTVVRGHSRGGRLLGYPTANVPVQPGLIVPADGVYAGWLSRTDESGPAETGPAETGACWPAAISVGTNPTFGSEDRQVEAYALDRDDLELYDVPVRVRFSAWLRGQRAFDGIDPLVAQMAADVARARELLESG